MGIDPYLKFIVGIETQKNDPRFSESERELILAAHNCYYLGEMLVPPLCRIDRHGLWEDVDLVTSWPIGKRERPEFNSVFYEGCPMMGDVWETNGAVVGYIIEDCHADYLLRGLYLVPGFIDLFGGVESGHVVLESMDPEEHEMEYRHASGGLCIDEEPDGSYRHYQKDQVDRAIAEGRWLPMFSPASTDRWFTIAIHLLHHAGWVGTTRDDLKIMVAFDWA